MIDIRERNDCRLCGGKLMEVFRLAPTPVANSFPTEPDYSAIRYPLELMKCDDCEHVQLRHVISGLFEDYKYVTPKIVETYQKPFAVDLRRTYPNAKMVLEIGCNNGVFLDCLAAEGFGVVGVDPASSHITAIKAPFTETLAKTMKNRFDLIVANNVFAHIDDIQDVFRGIKHALKDDGAIVFEVQYLPDLIANGGFDMVYHEHLDYHTLGPLAQFLLKMGFVMTDYQHIPMHGGSIRVTAARMGKPAYIRHENLNWSWLQQYLDFGASHLRSVLIENQPMVGFGAPAKATTMIHQFGIAPYINYVVDDTPIKQGRYIPGTDIQIRAVEELKPDENVLMLAWNFEKEIRERLPNHKIFHPLR